MIPCVIYYISPHTSFTNYNMVTDQAVCSLPNINGTFHRLRAQFYVEKGSPGIWLVGNNMFLEGYFK